MKEKTIIPLHFFYVFLQFMVLLLLFLLFRIDFYPKISAYLCHIVFLIICILVSSLYKSQNYSYIYAVFDRIGEGKRNFRVILVVFIILSAVSIYPLVTRRIEDPALVVYMIFSLFVVSAVGEITVFLRRSI